MSSSASFAISASTASPCGVQDFTHEVQEAVNRVQSVEESRRVVDRAREAGFGSVNIDPIYGLPLQTPETFRERSAP